MTDHTEHDLRALLAERGWLERLALRLVRDPAAAEDLTQETLLRAIDRGPALGGSGGASDARRRGWLSTVLRRLALQRHRAERRRRDRERAWAPFEEGDAESLRRAQLRRDLVDEVLRLPEPERTAVTLRYLEGRSYAEIAAAQSIGEPAARKRVSRGIARLRERLDEQHGGRAAWTALVLPWIGQDATTAATATAVAAAPKAGAWILTMKTQTKLAAAAAAILAAGMLAWIQLGRTPDASEGAQRDERADARLAGGAELEGVDAEAATAERAVAPAPDAPAEVASLPAFPDRPAETTGTLALRLVWPDGSPGAGVSVKLVAWSDPRPLLRARDHVADDEGLIVAEGLTAGRVSAYDDRRGGGRFDVRPGSVTNGTIELSDGFTVRGLVTAPDGTPTGGADIVLSDHGIFREAKVVGTSKPDGRYAIRGVTSGRSVSARLAGFAPSEAIRVGRHPDGAEHAIDLVLAPGGARVSGTVRDEHGAPLFGAFVRISPPDRETPDHREVVDPIEVWTDERGRFDAPDCGAGRVALWVRTEVHRPLHRSPRLQPGEHRDFDLVMKLGSTLTGRVTRADGTSASSATVWLGARHRNEVPRGFEVTTGPDGAFELPGLAAGRHDVTATERDQGKFEGSVLLDANDTVHMELKLTRGRTVTGRVVDERGEPLAGWMVGTLVGTGLWDRQAETHADGTFALTDVREDAKEIHAGAPDAWLKGTAASAPITEDPVVVRVPDTARPTAVLRLRVLADGRVPKPAARVEWAGESGYGQTEAFTDANGEVRLTGLLPGPGRVDIHAEGFAVSRRRTVLKSDGESDLGTVDLMRGGRVAVHLAPGAGSPPVEPPEGVALFTLSGDRVTGIELVDGKGLSEPVEAGRYLLHSGDSIAIEPRALLDVVNGKTTSFKANCRPGGEVMLTLDPPARTDRYRSYLVEVISADGTSWRRTRRSVLSRPSLERVFAGGLPAGVWTIRVETGGGQTGEVTVEVSPGAERPQSVELELH